MIKNTSQNIISLSLYPESNKKSRPVGKEYQRKKEQNVFYREAKFYSVDEVTEMLIGAGFSDLEYSQTLFNEEGVEEPELGCGKGSFVVVKACK